MTRVDGYDAETRRLAEDATVDAATDLITWNRKVDEELTRPRLTDALLRGVVTRADLVGWFAESLAVLGVPEGDGRTED